MLVALPLPLQSQLRKQAPGVHGAALLAVQRAANPARAATRQRHCSYSANQQSFPPAATLSNHSGELGFLYLIIFSFCIFAQINFMWLFGISWIYVFAEIHLWFSFPNLAIEEIPLSLESFSGMQETIW